MIARRLNTAWNGRALWMSLRRRHRIDDGVYVVACIEDDPALNAVALARVPELIADRTARGVVVLAAGAVIAAQVDQNADGIIAVEVLSERQIDALLTFYELYQFSPRIFFVSLTRPYANQLARMVDVNGLTLDDLVCLSMFRIRGWSGAAVAHA